VPYQSQRLASPYSRPPWSCKTTQGCRRRRVHQQRGDRRCAGTEDRQCRLIPLKIRRRCAIDDCGNDAGRQKSEGSEQADVPFALGFMFGDLSEGGKAAEPNAFMISKSNSFVIGSCIYAASSSRLSATAAGRAMMVKASAQRSSSWRARPRSFRQRAPSWGCFDRPEPFVLLA
jgi:hypothetical protein